LKQKWQNIPPGSVFGKSLEFIKNYSFKIKDHSNIDVNVCLHIVLSRHGGGFHRSRKILGHNGEWFGLQEGLLYHFKPK